MADMNITIGLDDRASRKLQNIDRAAKSLSASLKLAGAAAAAFATGSIAKGIVSQYMAYEKYRTVLTTFLGSQQKANKELERLQNLANVLPQDLQDVTEAFTILQRNGIDTSNKSLTAFSNIATANGKSLTQLGEAVADALTGEFERLKEFGIKVSRENGKFVAKIGDQQVAVGNSTTELVNGLQQLGAEGGKFGGAAAANADTLSQSFSNLQGSVFSTAVTIGEQLKPALKEAADITANWLNTHQQLIKALSSKAGDALLVIIKGIGVSLKVLEENANAVGMAIRGIFYLQAFRQLTFVVADLRKVFGGLGAAAGAAGAGVGSFGKAAQVVIDFGKVIGGLLTRIPLIGGALATVGRIAMTLGPLLLGPWGLVAAAIAAVIATLYYFKDTTITLGNTTTTVGETIAAAWWALSTVIGDLTKWFIDKFQYAYDTIAGGVGMVFNKFKEVFNGVLDIVKTVQNKMIGIIWGFFQFIWNNLKNLPAAFLQALNSSFVVVGEFVKRSAAMFGELWDYISSGGTDAIENTFTGLGDVVSAEINKIGSNITPVDWNAALNTDYIGIATGVVTENMGTLITTVTDSVGAAGETMVNNYRAHLAEVDRTTASVGQGLGSLRGYFSDMGGAVAGAAAQLSPFQTMLNATNTTIATNGAKVAELDAIIRQALSAFQAGTINAQQFAGVLAQVGNAASTAGVQLTSMQSVAANAIATGIAAADAAKTNAEALAYVEANATSLGLSGDALKQTQLALGKTFPVATAGAAAQAKVIETVDSTYKKAMASIDEFNLKQANTSGAMKMLEADFLNGKLSMEEFKQAMDSIGGNMDMITDKSLKMGMTFTEKLTSAIDGLSGSITSTLTDVFTGVKGGFEGMKDIALSVINTIISSLIENFIVAPLLKNINSALSAAFTPSAGVGGLFGGMGGGLFGMLGGLFGFAEGGSTARSGQKPILVGEKGPEIFFPGKSGAVLPNDKLGGGSSEPLVVNFNINAIDTQTGSEFLMKNKAMIIGSVQEAYQKRGRQGPLG